MTDDRDRQVVAVIAKATTDVEKDALSEWATRLLAIRATDLSAVQKAKQAIKLTTSSSVVWPIVKILGRDLKQLGWNDRSWPARLAVAGAAVGLTVFGGQSAGIAALGTAIGVPLWVVLGSGAAFAGVLAEEFTSKRR
jgi:hypothetical protein